MVLFYHKCSVCSIFPWYGTIISFIWIVCHSPSSRPSFPTIVMVHGTCHTSDGPMPSRMLLLPFSSLFIYLSNTCLSVSGSSLLNLLFLTLNPYIANIGACTCVTSRLKAEAASLLIYCALWNVLWCHWKREKSQRK